MPADRRRDTERNHTATHLLHAALRQVLGEAVHQAGSLVTPDRLRFDFTHHGPVNAERLTEIEGIVNREIWRGAPVTFREMPFQEARTLGAMALFGEKYGDVVRVVSIPGFSMELCGGTHVEQHRADRRLQDRRRDRRRGRRSPHRGGDRTGRLRSVPRRGARAPQNRGAAEVTDRRRGEARGRIWSTSAARWSASSTKRCAAAATSLQSLLQRAQSVGANGSRLVASVVRASDVKELQALGDAVREKLGSGVGVLAASFEDGKNALLVVVTDDLREKGVRADALIKDIAAAAGGRGGGKPHMAQAGIPDAARFDDALSRAPQLVRTALGQPS